MAWHWKPAILVFRVKYLFRWKVAWKVSKFFSRRCCRLFNFVWKTVKFPYNTYYSQQGTLKYIFPIFRFVRQTFCPRRRFFLTNRNIEQYIFYSLCYFVSFSTPCRWDQLTVYQLVSKEFYWSRTTQDPALFTGLLPWPCLITLLFSVPWQGSIGRGLGNSAIYWLRFPVCSRKSFILEISDN